MDLEKLDLEEVDKEMAADEAAQSSAAKTDAPENALESGGAAAKSISLHLLVFVTASPASHLAERMFKHFPFSDCIPVLRI